MIDRILAVADSCDYDFRRTAQPSDPLSYLFDEWVPYYRTKWAIARVLQPQTILEIGVRFGYSALAFLDAVPSARYLGIDNDSDTFGGHRGAVEVARSKLQAFSGDVVVADSLDYKHSPVAITISSTWTGGRTSAALFTTSSLLLHRLVTCSSMATSGIARTS